MLGSRVAAGRVKKSKHALEQDRPDVLERRIDGQLDLGQEKLTFITKPATRQKWRLRGVQFEESVAELACRTAIRKQRPSLARCALQE